ARARHIGAPGRALEGAPGSARGAAGVGARGLETRLGARRSARQTDGAGALERTEERRVVTWARARGTGPGAGAPWREVM
ncbi:hypothetical protein, partial [Streptomyces sp. NPDC005799]|uniref:hypothetical protein n=1 Tax=Streptomyces sp. NPDC005799 TaxID=3154678 RepID=UPI0034072CA0